MAICQHCQKRLGTESYYGDTTAMGWIHSTPQMWCKRCVLEEQLKYARERAAQAPILEAELAALRD